MEEEPIEKAENFLISKHDFNMEVEQMAHEDGSYIDAIVETCESNQLDIEDAVKMLSRSLIHKLKREATENNLLKEQDRHHTLTQFFGEHA